MSDWMPTEGGNAGVVTFNGVRPLYAIAAEIKADWKNVYFGAVPYLDAMRSLGAVTENYGCDSAKSIVIYFLGNATSWRGDVARRVKAELKAMIK